MAAAVIAGLAGLAVAAYSIVGAGTKRATDAGNQSAAAVLPSCRADQLRLSAPSAWDVASGSLLEPMTLTRVSGSGCSLAGWPAVRRLDRAGRIIPARTFRYTYDATDSVPFHTVSLSSGRAASFNFFAPDWNHVADRPCATARKLEIRLPGGHSWLAIASKIPACSVLYVDPLVPGRTDGRWGTVGSQQFARP